MSSASSLLVDNTKLHSQDCPFEIGNTPLRRFQIDIQGLGHEICVKDESANAFGSIKDRVAWYILSSEMVKNPGVRHFVDASSGNYGYALASIGRELGLDITIVSSPSITAFNAAGIRGADARLVIAESEHGESSNAARMRVAAQIAEETGACFLNQYESGFNPACHRVWTAPETLEGNRFDACFVSASSGGTGRGFADYLTGTDCRTQLMHVEPPGSNAFLDAESSERGPSLPGFGSGRKSTFSAELKAPEMIRIEDAHAVAAFTVLRDISILPIGLSSVAVVLGAIEWLTRQSEQRRVVCMCADGSERYADELESRYIAALEPAAFRQIREGLRPVLEKLSRC